MNIFIKLCLTFIMTCYGTVSAATSDSTNVPAASQFSGYTQRQPVHFVAMIHSPGNFNNTEPYRNDWISGWAITGYRSASLGPAVPAYLNSFDPSSYSPFLYSIYIPYTGKYRIGGMLNIYQTGTKGSGGTVLTQVALTLEGGSMGTYPLSSTKEVTVDNHPGATTPIDLGNYFQAYNVSLNKGDKLFLWMWAGSGADVNKLFIVAGSFVTIDSVDF